MVTRDFTVAIFVVEADRVLLHFHPGLRRWLPPGGHIEPGELPDEAAVREVKEESGLDVVLVGDPLITLDEVGQPRQLCRPAGIQLEPIRDGHEHIDLIYFACPTGGVLAPEMRWCDAEARRTLEVGTEIDAWSAAAISAIANWTQRH